MISRISPYKKCSTGASSSESCALPSLASLHIAKKSLGLDDDTYRTKLANITGKTSAKDMTEAERQAVLSVFRSEGFAAPAQKPSKVLVGRYAKKLQALWIAAHNLDLVHDRRDAALLAFVKRQTGIDHTRFLHYADDAAKVIEALKGWLKREAGVMYGNTNGQDWLRLDGAKVAWAQWRILHPEASLLARGGFDAEVFSQSATKGQLVQLTPKDWQAVNNTFGRRIRARSKDGAAS
ncbi:Mu-like prophage protein gp16 [Rhizobium sp. RU35A]|uniref:regulatory protein GemA n=1 Tax=Rhizobium sp. RU35A TaxID=1907414 RepID=UPI000955FF2C|nr:regulatory protein GemA [Rhizobium sp. RU35A]SIR41314.1 Mu-like prophage protein gp16 [Rhizobium sp. RU35A]